MRRDLEHQLLEWKRSKRRKPLVLRGARQVGKTHLLKWFGKNHYSDVAYFNFEEEPALGEFFQGKLSPAEILSKLSIYRGKKIVPEETLLLFDEIQLSDHALTSLKYFNESSPKVHLIAAGSLLGIKLSHAKSFPVGKVDFLSLDPVTFFEFLSALGKDDLRAHLEEIKYVEPISKAFHQELSDLFRVYLFVGGMPEAVNIYALEKNIEEVRKIQKNILRSYGMDFSKHAPKSDVLKITQIWESIPSQLARENKKFIFTAVARSARAREYESALKWLEDAGLILKSVRVEVPRFPLSGYADLHAFKIFMFDIGLLGAMANLPSKIVLEGKSELFTEFKGALVENFIAQELTATLKAPLFYWKSAGEAEVDFLIQDDHQIFPLEIKSGGATNSKSLKLYQEKFKPVFSVRASMLNLLKQELLINYPLYLTCRIPFLKNGSAL